MYKIRMKKTISIAACLAAICLVPDALAAGDTELALGLEAASDYRYGLALAHFKRAGEQGNVQAQRTVGLMLLKGESLYGSEVKADRVEALSWLTLAANNGCQVSKFILGKSASTAGKRPGYHNKAKGHS